MGQITSGIGIVSGLNTSAIISALLTFDQAPVKVLQGRVTNDNSRVAAFTQLKTQLGSLKTISDGLGKTASFQASTATSSDPSVLTATTVPGAALGSFQFQVSQLVSTQQAITAGFADPNNARVGAGTLSISLGGGELTNPTPLNAVNGGAGVQRGTFKITDASGKTAAINITNAINLDDVAKQINTSLDINIKATVGKTGLILQDQSGGAGTLTVRDIGDGTTAADLGIAGPATNGTITGSTINGISKSTSLAQLNGGTGLKVSPLSNQPDFRVLVGDGSLFDVSLSSAKTIGDVVDAINTASGGKLTASIAANGQGLQLTDTSGGGGPLVVADLYSTAAEQLGIAVDSVVGSLTGSPLVAGLDSVPLADLNGGKGLTLGKLDVTDRNGVTKQIDLAAATSVQDVIAAINLQGAGSVKASLNSAQDGIQIQDASGGNGTLTIANGDAFNSATALGLAGAFGDAQTVINGSNLHRQYISTTTALADYNGGKGVAQTKFTITASNGAQSEIDLTSGTAVSLGDVISNINARGIGVTASLNTTGDGLLLTDTAGGAGKLTVKDENGTAAADLNIAGIATGTTIDGSFTKTLTLDQNDTLNTVIKKINDLGAGVTASIINDGSASNPYRLSITAANSGLDGRFIFDAGATNLQTTNLVQAQNAAVFVGGQGSAQPLLVTSSKNQITNLIKGVTIDLNGVSSKPVTLNIAQDSTGLVSQLNDFVTGFNALATQLGTLTAFDTSTEQGGLLLGNATADQIQNLIYEGIVGTAISTGKYRTLADIGISVADKGQLSFDAAKFQAALATDPTGVQTLFTQAATGAGAKISNDINQLIDPVNGAITVQNQTLATQTKQFQDRITQLNFVIQAKQTRLQQQFASMETILSSLQSQQAALGTLSSFSTGTTTKSNSSKSSSASTSSTSSG